MGEDNESGGQRVTEKVAYIVTAHIHRVKIRTKNPIMSKIRWKRRESKAETRVVESDKEFLSFQESLVLPLTFIYDKRLERYVDKNTDIYCIVIQNNGLKHGGEAKYNVSEILNEGLENKQVKIEMGNSPDKSCYVEVSFKFQREKLTESQAMDLKSQSASTSNQNHDNDENTSIFLGEHSSIQESYGKSKQNISINKRSFLKDKTNSKTKPELSVPLSADYQQENKQLRQKVKLLETTIKQASIEIKRRDKEIIELKQTIIPEGEMLLRREREKNKELERRLEIYERREEQKQLGSKIQELREQLSDTKVNIGNILNTADDIGGSLLVSQLFASIGVTELSLQ